MTKKKVVDNSIYNFDIMEFFRTGKKERLDDIHCSIDDNLLCVDTDYYGNKLNKRVPIGIKSHNFIIVNGDDINSDAEDERNSLQQKGKDEITTSFICLENAGLKLNGIEVIDTTEDLSKSAKRGSKKFKDFEKTVPQGATYHESRWGTKNQIQEKWYHRAGSMLIKYKGVNYICGMDNDSYFVSKLKTSPKTVEGAFKSLKPKRVSRYEKETGKQALRQGEWFFIPVPNIEATDMEMGVDLPHQEGGNPHTVNFYEESKGRHYCKGRVSHKEHGTRRLGKEDELFEAIQSTASNSWSVQGVD